MEDNKIITEKKTKGAYLKKLTDKVMSGVIVTVLGGVLLMYFSDHIFGEKEPTISVKLEEGYHQTLQPDSADIRKFILLRNKIGKAISVAFEVEDSHKLYLLNQLYSKLVQASFTKNKQELLRAIAECEVQFFNL